ncbi:hypothetical protein GQ457_02G020530 [Hibiscus cannabinus]
MDKSSSPGLAPSGSKDRGPWLNRQIITNQTQRRLVSDLAPSGSNGQITVVDSALFDHSPIVIGHQQISPRQVLCRLIRTLFRIWYHWVRVTKTTVSDSASFDQGLASYDWGLIFILSRRVWTGKILPGNIGFEWVGHISRPTNVGFEGSAPWSGSIKHPPQSQPLDHTTIQRSRSHQTPTRDPWISTRAHAPTPRIPCETFGSSVHPTRCHMAPAPLPSSSAPFTPVTERKKQNKTSEIETSQKWVKFFTFPKTTNVFGYKAKSKSIVPQRIRCFLWLAGRQKLMNNMERCKRALTDDPICPLCRDAEESVLHTLRDCVNMQRIWKQAIPRSLLPTFFSKPMKDWLRQNLCTNIMSHINIPWKLVFASILWQSWKNRNDAVFHANSESPGYVLSRSIGLAHYYYDGWLQPQPTINPSMPSSPWISPEPGWVCLNVDGVVSFNTGKSSIGGLLRDHSSNFIFGFSKFIGCTNSLHAELWSLLVGLQLAWAHGVDLLQVQTDCRKVIQLLQEPHVDSYSISLVHSIRQLWRKAWFIDIIWTSRSGNNVADKLVKLADLSSFDTTFFSSPPAELLDILASDNLALPL